MTACPEVNQGQGRMSTPIAVSRPLEVEFSAPRAVNDRQVLLSMRQIYVLLFQLRGVVDAAPPRCDLDGGEGLLIKG